MKIIIYDKNYSYDYLKVLVKWIARYLISKFNPIKAMKLEKYIQENLGTDIKLIKVIRLAAKNLEIISFINKYEIGISETVLLPDTDIKLIDVCKTINYGTLSIQGYPIFDDVFSYFEKNIDEFYNLYRKGLFI